MGRSSGAVGTGRWKAAGAGRAAVIGRELTAMLQIASVHAVESSYGWPHRSRAPHRPIPGSISTSHRPIGPEDPFNAITEPARAAP